MTLAENLNNIPYDDTQNYISVDYNYWLKRFDTQLNEPTNQNSITVPKLSSQRIKKTFIIKLWGLVY